MACVRQAWHGAQGGRRTERFTPFDGGMSMERFIRVLARPTPPSLHLTTTCGGGGRVGTDCSNSPPVLPLDS